MSNKRVIERIMEVKIKEVKRKYEEEGVWMMDWSLPPDIQAFLIKWKKINDEGRGLGGGIKW